MVDANGQYDRSHTRGIGKPPDNSVDFFQGGFDASWEVDVLWRTAAYDRVRGTQASARPLKIEEIRW